MSNVFKSPDNTPILEKGWTVQSSNGSNVTPIAGPMGLSSATITADAVAAVTANQPTADAASRAAVGQIHLDSFTGTDDQRMAAAITAAVAGTTTVILLAPRAHTFAIPWLTSYVSSSATMNLKIKGTGTAFNGAWGAPGAATTCTFTCTGVEACMNFQHNGSIELSDLRVLSANAGVPLFQTTNATPNIHDCVFSGGASGAACITDAVVLGGNTATIGAGDTAKYNAYQGTVYRNFFDGVRTCVLFNQAANSVNVHENTVSTSCGSAQQFGAAFSLIGTSSKSINDVQIWGNCVEVSNYPYGIYGIYAQECHFGPNGFYDPTSKHRAAIYLDTLSNYNTIESGFHSDSYQFVVDTPGNSTVRNGHQTMWSYTRQPQMFVTNTPFKYLDNNATGLRALDGRGNYVAIGPVNDAAGSGGYAGCNIVSGNGTSVTDAATVNGSHWVTSNTAAFTSTDVPCALYATGIPTTSLIVNTVTPTTAWAWAASGVYVLGDIVRPTTANSHLYQCTTAGTASSTAPTWPTSGGTVTDGTVVWTDLGTTTTAAYISLAATASATGLTLAFGRLGQAQRTLMQFARFHMITQGSAPTCTADAGAGSGPSGIATAGTDHAFTVAITTGTATASGDMFHTASSTTWATQPKFSMTAGNAAAAALMAGGYWITVSTGTATVNFVNAPAISTAYAFSLTALA